MFGCVWSKICMIFQKCWKVVINQTPPTQLNVLHTDTNSSPGTSPNHWKNVHLTMKEKHWKPNNMIKSYQILTNDIKHSLKVTPILRVGRISADIHGWCWHWSYVQMGTRTWRPGRNLPPGRSKQATHKKKRALRACSSSRQSDRRQEISWDLPQAVNGIGSVAGPFCEWFAPLKKQTCPKITSFYMLYLIVRSFNGV